MNEILCAAALIALVGWSGRINPIFVLGGVFLIGVGFAFSAPAYTAAADACGCSEKPSTGIRSFGIGFYQHGDQLADQRGGAIAAGTSGREMGLPRAGRTLHNDGGTLGEFLISALLRSISLRCSAGGQIEMERTTLQRHPR
ncbi:MAG TPA: hypothetical protein VFG11_00345, partial [Acidobacteriota bacterium]|nr:hypothetical protein [Acidobacteriota bacterium]